MLSVIRLIGPRHITAHPLRTILTIIGIGLGVAVSLAIQLANSEIFRSFQEAVQQAAGRSTLEISGENMGFDERIITTVRTHPDVRAANPVLFQRTQVAEGHQEGQFLLIVGVDLLELAADETFRFTAQPSTKQPLEALLSPSAVFVGRRLATEWNLREGMQLQVAVGAKQHSLTVRGIIESTNGPGSTWDRAAFMDIATAQNLFEQAGRLDRIDIVTEPGRSVEEVAVQIQALLREPLVVTRPPQRNKQVERMIAAMQTNLTVLGGVGLLIGFLLVYNTVSFIVVQHRREIGILRALGMSRSGVVGLFLAEASIVGFVGGAIGCVMGTFLARAVVGLLRRTISELYVSISSSSIQQNLGLDIPADVWFQGWALGIGVSMLGALGPSLDAGSTVPARALAAGEYEARQEARTRILAWAGVSGLFVSVLLAFPGPVHGLPLWGYASAFFLLVSVSCLSPVIVQTGSALIGKLCSTTGGRQWTMLSHVAVEQVARAPGRSSVTVSAIMVGLAVTVGVGLMIHSFRRTVEHWIDQTILADLVVAPAAWLQGGNKGIRPDHMPAAWKDALIAIPGVAAVDPYRELTVEIEGRSVALITRDLMLHAQRGRYLFTEGSSVDVLRNTVLSEGAVLSEVLAETLNVRKGGTLRLRTPSGVMTLPITGVFYDYATDGGKLVMDGELYRRFWGDHAATVFALYLVDGASASDVRRSIEEQLGRSGQVVVLENADIKAEILAIFDRTFRITYALEFIAVLIALLGIVNTLLTSIMERQRELATLRALGASSRQVLWLLLLESCWLGFLGAILGVVTGVVLGGLLIFVVNKQSFGWTIEPALSGWLLIQTMGLALAASVIAAYFPARWAARQSLSEGLSYE